VGLVSDNDDLRPCIGCLALTRGTSHVTALLDRKGERKAMVRGYQNEDETKLLVPRDSRRDVYRTETAEIWPRSVGNRTFDFSSSFWPIENLPFGTGLCCPIFCPQCKSFALPHLRPHASGSSMSLVEALWADGISASVAFIIVGHT